MTSPILPDLHSTFGRPCCCTAFQPRSCTTVVFTPLTKLQNKTNSISFNLILSNHRLHHNVKALRPSCVHLNPSFGECTSQGFRRHHVYLLLPRNFTTQCPQFPINGQYFVLAIGVLPVIRDMLNFLLKRNDSQESEDGGTQTEYATRHEMPWEGSIERSDNNISSGQDVV